jgi:hypothetical protein
MPVAALVDCEAQFPIRQPFVALIDKGTVLIDATALAACVAAYQQDTTACTLNGILAACSGVLLGTKAPGQVCAGLEDCQRDQGPATCVKIQPGSVAPATGTCVKNAHGRSGDPCVSSCPKGNDCSTDTISGTPDPVTTLCFEADGLYCSYAADPSVCAPIVAADNACDFSFAMCGSLASCNADSSTCRPVIPLGQACQFSSDCASGLLCSNSKCVEQPFSDESTCSGFLPAP